MNSTPSPYLPVDVVFDSRQIENRDFPTFQVEPALENVVAYQVLWTNVPFSFYTIDQSNNQFIMKCNNALDELIEQVITIKPGTYTPEALRNQLRAAIGSSVLPDAVHYDCLIQPNNARFFIYNKRNSNSSRPFYLQFLDSSLASMLGFVANTTYTATWGQYFKDGEVIKNTTDPPGPGGENVIWGLEAPRVSNLMQSPYLHFHATFNGMRNDAARMHDGYDQLLITTPITSNFTSMILYQGIPEPINLGGSYSIYNLAMYLTHGERTEYRTLDNQRVNYLPLNGEGFQVCIRFYVDNGVKMPPR
jgi:hypothetical protein